MFTKTELDTAITLVQSKRYSLHQSFTVQMSSSVRDEADFYFFRADKKYYRDGAHFWLCCVNWLEEKRMGFQLLSVQRYPGQLRSNFSTNILLNIYNLCQDISPDTFQAIIGDYSSQLKSVSIPHSYTWEGQIQQAMQMYDEWNDQSFIAETESELLAFHWETSA